MLFAVYRLESTSAIYGIFTEYSTNKTKQSAIH